MTRRRKTILVISVTLWFAVSVYAQEERSFDGFNLQGYTKSGEKAWEVNSDTAQLNGTEIDLENVDADIYGTEDVNLTSETGVYDKGKGTMHLEGDVVITREDGSQLLTDSLDWSREEDLVTTADDVFITDEGYTVTGTGLEAQPGFKTAKILEDVTVHVDTEPETFNSKVMTITCDGPMTIDQMEHIATFDTNVLAIQGDRTLKADRMEVYFNDDMNDITEIFCIGNVEIFQGENKSFADKAVYNAARQTLVLSGRPKMIMLTEGENAITSIGD